MSGAGFGTQESEKQQLPTENVLGLSWVNWEGEPQVGDYKWQYDQSRGQGGTH